MNKSTVIKLIIFCLCSLVFLYSFIGCVIVSHAAETDVVTVTYTVEDLKKLFESVDAYALYQGQQMPVDKSDLSVLVDNNAFYGFYLNNGIDGIVTYEFKFPYEATVLSSDISIISNTTSFNVAWENTLNAPILWELYGITTESFSTGDYYLNNYNFIGNVQTQSLYISVNESHSESNNGVLVGIKSLTVTYEGSEFNEIVDQLKEQNIILEGIENAIEETNEKLDDVKTSIEQSSQDIIDNQNKNHEDLTTSTEEDKAELDELEQDFQDVKDKADEYNEAMESVDKPEADEVLSEDAVADIFENEDVSQGQPYIFSILESLQSITWLLTMILISVTVGIIKYIIYGKS